MKNLDDNKIVADCNRISELIEKCNPGVKCIVEYVPFSSNALHNNCYICICSIGNKTKFLMLPYEDVDKLEKVKVKF